MDTWAGFPTYQVFFDQVRVPRTNLVGELNRGWDYIVMALDFERIALGSVGGVRRLLDDLIVFCRATVVDGRPLAVHPHVRSTLAELEADVEAARMLGWLNVWTVDQGRVPVREASMVKVFAGEVRQRVCDWGLALLDLHGLIGEGPWAPLRGRLQRMYRASPIWRFGGGTNEIQRNIIARYGLGLPRGD